MYCISYKTLKASFILTKYTKNTSLTVTGQAQDTVRFLATVTHSLVYHPSTNAQPSLLGGGGMIR